VTFSQVAVQFPRLAAELGRLSGEDLQRAVERIVDQALTATGAEVPSRDPAEVERLVWSLDDVAWNLQEQAEQGRASQAVYHHAFRRARAASALFELVEGRYGQAVFEATYALDANEDVVLQLLSAGPAPA
jgi:hypothetical protein